MTDRIERELKLDAPVDEVWDAITSDGWLADEVQLDLSPGGDASFRSDAGTRSGWVEQVLAPARLTFWWAAGDQPASRVELTLIPDRDGGTRLRVVESRPLEVLDLVGIPLGAGRLDLRPGAGGRLAMATTSDRAGAVFGALSDPTRRVLLQTIASQPTATATELASELPISRQAVLKHLAALADAGLVQRERSGREVRYRVTPEPLSDAVSWMADVGGQWDDRLAALKLVSLQRGIDPEVRDRPADDLLERRRGHRAAVDRSLRLVDHDRDEQFRRARGNEADERRDVRAVGVIAVDRDVGRAGFPGQVIAGDRGA